MRYVPITLRLPQCHILTISEQDWLYDEGEDATKAVYISKIEELRSSAGPIIQRYQDKLQEDAEKRREEEAAKQKQADEARKASEAAKKAEEDSKKPADADMKDAGPETEEMD